EVNVLPFSIADMEFMAPMSVIRDMTHRARHGIYGYTLRSEGYYDAIINWNKTRNNWEINKEYICHSPGIVTALNLIIQTYTSIGDGIVIQSPVYYPFINSIKNNQRKVVFNELINDNGTYKIDYLDLENQLKREDVKLLFFCSPHNPVGRVWNKEELIKIGNLCLKHNVLIISDEVHSDILLNGSEHNCLAKLSDDLSNNSITCMAPSKTFNLAGLQTSTIIIPNNNLRRNYLKTLESLSLNKITPFGLTGVESAYKNGEDWLNDLINKLEDNLKFIENYLISNITDIKLIQPQGTYLAWMDCRSLGMSDKELESFMLNEAKVNVRQGYQFGPGGSGFIR